MMMKRYCGVISRKCSSHFPPEYHDNASAELIGSIIIIGLFVAAFGIVLMTLLSSSSDFVVPAVVIEPQPITEWNGTYVLDMQAGDTLLRDETRIIVDGSDKTARFVEDPSFDPGDTGWQEWGAGDSLYLDYSSAQQPNAVQVIYYSPEGDGILLWELGSTENRLPVASFSANVTGGNSPLSVLFTDASSNNPTSWLWSFGDGETSTLQNPVHTYASPGDYTVRLTVTNQYDSDTLVKTSYIHVTDGFTVDFVGIPLSGTAPLMVTFTDQTTGVPTAWSWNFGDGATSTQQNPVHTYTAGGTYTVTLQATVDNVTQTETKSEYINVTSNCIPGLYGAYVDEFNDEYWVPFSGNPTYRVDEVLWFADDTSGWDSIEDNWPVATLGKTNQFSVTYGGYLIVPANDTYTIYLTSDDGSVLWLDNVLDTSPVLIDNWGGDGLHGPEEVSATVTLTEGRHPIRIKMTENWGGALLHLEWASSTITRERIDSFCHIPGGLTEVDFTAAPVSGVAPLEVQFTDLSVGNISSWAWEFGDGGTSTDENPVHTYTTAGEYTVILTVLNANISYTEEKIAYIYVTEGCLPGLQGTYYDEYNSAYTVPFSGNSVQRVDSRLWFADSESGEESDEDNWPVATLGQANDFSVEYVGSLIVPKDETYTFSLRSDDGSVLWIDNIADTDPVFIDNWGLHSAITVTASRTLTEGKHPIRVKMTENNGDAVLHLSWESASIPLQPVESFCHGNATLLSAAFDATPLNGTRPLSVQFTDHSTGTITSWLWDFGDGATSALQSPAHVYTDSGQYTVSLSVTDGTATDTETKDQYINVSGMPDPVAWWRFDEASGSTAIDSSGNGNDGTIEGGAADRRTGACGTGLYFDGTSTWVSVPDDATLSFNDTFTFAGWFRAEVPEIDSTPNEYKYYTQLIGKGYDYYNTGQFSNNYEIFLRVENDRLSFEANGASDSSSTNGFLTHADGLPLSYDDWFHLAVVVDGSTGTVYIDGNQEGTFVVSRTPLKENTEPVSIGKQIVSIDWAEFYYRGMMDELYLYGTALTAGEVTSLKDACTPPAGDPPEVTFTASPLTGDAPLAVQFTSNVTGTAPLTYLWSFGDGTTSADANPLHTYANAGTYDVNLTVTNAYGTDTLERAAYVEVTAVVVSAFAQYVVDENVFVYGEELSFAGDTVTGSGATIHITGDELDTNNLNGGTSLAVSNIYVDGSIDLNGGSAGLGSEINPGSIYVNGDLKLRSGSRVVYGDVYVNGDCVLKDPVIHGTMYIDGDLQLSWTPDLSDATVYYTGKFTHPGSMSSSILDKCEEVDTVPGFTIPAYEMPSVKSDDFYSTRGYVSSGALADNLRIFADSYTSSSWVDSVENVIIVAKTGDITLTGLGGSGVTGILFAPNGEVVFNGGSFEGLVIAKDGFTVTSGGTDVTFKNMDQYISNPADYLF